MAKTARIRTPFWHQLKLFRLQALPSGVFVVCALLTVWLWQRQTPWILLPVRSQTISTSVEQPPRSPQQEEESSADEDHSVVDLDPLMSNAQLHGSGRASVQ